MVCNLNVSTTKLTNLSAVIEGCYGIQADDSAVVVKLDLPGNGESQLHNLTSAIFSMFLNSTRTGSAHMQAGIPIRTFLSSMLVSAVYFLFQLILFTILRNKLRCIYQTKSFRKLESSATEPEKSKSSFKKLFSWIPTVLFNPIEEYRDKVGLDAYFFLRFLRALTIFFLTLSVLNIPILVPIHYQSTMSNATGDPPPWLDRMNISSLVAQNSSKLVFHLILAIFAVLWFHAFLIRELGFVYEVSLPLQRKTPAMLLVERVPESLIGNTLEVISEFESVFPRSVVDVRFLPRAFKNLRKLRKRTQKAADKVEVITMEIILSKFFLKACEEGNEMLYALSCTQKLRLRVNKSLFYLRTLGSVLNGIRMRKKSICGWINLPSLHFSSSSYNSQMYLSLERATLQHEKASANWSHRCSELQKRESSGCDPGNRALQSQLYLDKLFVKFTSMNVARAVAHLLQNGSDDEWRNVHLISDLKDVIWRNMATSNSTMIQIRSVSANLLGVLLTVGYILPVAFVGLISQIPYLTSLTPFHSDPNSGRGSELFREMMAGIIPVITLIILTEFVPIIFWWLSLLRCKKTLAEVQTDTQNWFFAFLFVHVFLVVTISSSLSIVVEKIVNNPVSIPTMLAQDLPKSSNFFCSFILVRGLAYSGGNLLQIKELLFEFYYRLRLYTPRQRMKRIKMIPTFQWCSVYPIFSVLACIGIVYSVISPLILPLSCFAFSLVMFSFKYLYEFQYDQEHFSGTEGRLYPSSLMQIYAGVYCMEICMIGLFALGNCFKLSISMIVTLGLTITAHVKIYRLCLERLQRFNFKQHYLNYATAGTFGNSNSRCIDLPFANGHQCSKMLVLRDTQGTTVPERDHLARKFHLDFEIGNFTISRTGDIVYPL